MKLPVLALSLFAASISAQAAEDRPVCVQARRIDDYNARPISAHAVLARSAVGDRRAVRLGTSCIHIDRMATVGLHSMTHCIGKGDEVGITVPGGPREICRVTNVSTVPEDYAAAEYKY